ncbi:amino acid ABC transporter substrate-binding protein, PAAT family [Rhizobiales bacterium GAS113]|nr:amino acid ABC transporter substrate-binding protein, PAAT family [Rhizobiales bacterium GAS113]
MAIKHVLMATGLTLAAALPAQATTLESVKARGFVQCGVSVGTPGFSAPDKNGQWSGLDVDLCRAVAAAVLGDATKVKYRPLEAMERFIALQSGEVDLLSRNSSWTYKADVSFGLNFVGVNYYDGQGFLVPKALKAKSPKDLNGATICVRSGTTTELNLADYFRSNKLTFTPVVYGNSDQLRSAYEAGRCDALTGDRSNLATQQLLLAKPEEHALLPDVISKEPLGPLVRNGDNQWGNIVRWSLNAMILGEELGLTSANSAELRKSSTDQEVRRLLGVEGNMGAMMGVPNEWGFNILAQVGNYQESFDRNVGAGSPLKLERGVNALWSKGGILFSPPMR